MPKKGSGTIEQIDLSQFSRSLSSQQTNDLLETLENRFLSNMSRHENIEWNEVQSRLKNDSKKLQSLYAMEITGGEPDVIGV